MGPLLWIVFLSDLFHLIPDAKAFTDGTLSIWYESRKQDAVIEKLRDRLGQKTRFRGEMAGFHCSKYNSGYGCREDER